MDGHDALSAKRSDEGKDVNLPPLASALEPDPSSLVEAGRLRLMRGAGCAVAGFPMA